MRRCLSVRRILSRRQMRTSSLPRRTEKGRWPVYSGKLTDPQIKDVVAYIRTLQKK